MDAGTSHVRANSDRTLWLRYTNSTWISAEVGSSKVVLDTQGLVPGDFTSMDWSYSALFKPTVEKTLTFVQFDDAHNIPFSVWTGNFLDLFQDPIDLIWNEAIGACTDICLLTS